MHGAGNLHAEPVAMAVYLNFQSIPSLIDLVDKEADGLTPLSCIQIRAQTSYQRRRLACAHEIIPTQD